MLAVEINPKNYKNLGKNLRDDDDIFNFFVNKDKKMWGYASERLTDINPLNTTHYILFEKFVFS